MIDYNVATTGAWKRALSDQKEFNEAFPPDIKTLKIIFPDPKNIMYFEVEVRPDTSYWAGGAITFTVSVS